MKKIVKHAAFAGTLAVTTFAANVAFAQTDADSILGTIGSFINQLIPILIAGALAYFIFGVIKFVIASDADAKADARKVVVQGIIGLFVIISVWGLVGVIQQTFGIGAGGEIGKGTLPGVVIQ